LYIILLAIYNSISVPLSVAFNTVGANQENGNLGYEVWERSVDCCFAIDIIVNFFYTFIDKDGDEIFQLKAIAKNYIVSGRFFIDLAATIPFELLPTLFGMDSSSKTLGLFQILKMVRLLRLRRIVSYLRLKNDFKLTIRIAVIVFNLYLFCHLIACFWYLLVSSEKEWKPANDEEHDFYSDDHILQNYAISLYYGILMMMGYDLLPINTNEALYGSAVMILGSIVTAALFGHVTLLLQSMNRKTANFHEQLDTASQAMSNIGLNLDIQTKVLDYISYTYANKDQQEELDLFFKMLSPGIKLEVSMTLFRGMLNLNPFFSNQPELIEFLIINLTTTLSKPETSVIRRGETADCMYFIASGSVKIVTQTEDLTDESLSVLDPGSYFGEIALLTDTQRTATVETLNYSTLARLSQEDFNDMLSRSAVLKKEITDKIHNYPDSWQTYLVRMLRSLPYFRKCTHDELSSLAYVMKAKQYEAGSCIVRHNETISSIVFIAHGRVNLTTEFKDKRVVLLEVGKEGVLFVNSALQIYSQAFTVEVAETSLLLMLDQESLRAQCRKYPNLNARVVGHKSRFGLEEIPRKSDMYLSRTQMTPSMKFKLTSMRVMIGKRQARQKSISFKIQQLVESVKRLIQENKKGSIEATGFISNSDILRRVLRATNDMSEKVDVVSERMRLHSSKLEHIKLRVAQLA
jgi:CRP-like cAMP-binding protein